MQIFIYISALPDDGGGNDSNPLILAPTLCIEKDTESDEIAKAELLSTIFFVSGVATFLQTTFGSRYRVNVTLYIVCTIGV